MDITAEHSVGSIVVTLPETAGIFTQLGIDFCCNGHRSLAEACDEAGLKVEEVVAALEKREEMPGKLSLDPNVLSVEELVDHIVSTHHGYIAKQVAPLQALLAKIVGVHGKNHPSLGILKDQFDESCKALSAHLKKEELMLFPYLINLEKAMLRKTSKPYCIFGSASELVEKMHTEHDQEGKRFRTFAELTDQYTPPVDACQTFRITYQKLLEFQTDLHLHIHLENNILFPKALKMETALSA